MVISVASQSVYIIIPTLYTCVVVNANNNRIIISIIWYHNKSVD